MKKTVRNTLLLLTISVFAAETAPLNIGGSMDLGDPGKPVPGWDLWIRRIGCEEVRRQPEKLFATRTVPGKEGFALATPCGDGLNFISLESNSFYIHEDGELEISFDYRTTRKGSGKHLLALYLECRGDRDAKRRKNQAHPVYPVLSGFSVTPTETWQHAVRRFRVIRWRNSYLCRFNLNARKGNLDEPVFIDNFRIRRIGTPDSPVEEAAVIPARDGAAYFKGETMDFTINARIRSRKQSLRATLSISGDYNGAILKRIPLVLERRGFRYEARTSLRAETYGSFHFSLETEEGPLPVCGDFSVLHPPVRHPEGTPGWGIGFNAENFGDIKIPHDLMYRLIQLRCWPSFRCAMGRARLAGMNLVRIWGKWNMIEPRPGEFRKGLVGDKVDQALENGLDVLFCLGGSGLVFCRDTEKYGYLSYPPSLRPFLKPVGEKEEEMLLDGPDTLWDDYLNFCLKTWGEKIRYWEFLNEPGLRNAPPELYIRYLKHVYRRIKAFRADLQVLGNGTTSDLGSDRGWPARLNRVDPDYVDFMDLCAFHPYNNSSDYLNHVTGVYSDHLAELRSHLKKEKPLWNTECFYIVNARKPQIRYYKTLQMCEPEAIQRHYLDGMLNGVRAALSPTERFLIKENPRVTAIPALSSMATATNALSAHLAGMTSLEAVRINSGMRAGIFRGNGDQAVGFVYDLRPSGSILRRPALPVRITDLFGNERKETRIPVSFEPVYIFGKSADVRKFFETVRFVPVESFRLTAKPAGGRLHLHARNQTGISGIFRISFPGTDALPETEFRFAEGDGECSVALPFSAPPLKTLKWKAEGNGESFGEGTVKLLPPVPEYELGTKESDARNLPVGENGSIRFWADGEALKFHAEIVDPEIIPSPTKEPWNGDCLELFLDPDPFHRLDQEKILPTIPLHCFQYCCGAVPTRKGNLYYVVSRGKFERPRKQIMKIRRRYPDGAYRLTGEIPWSNFRTRPSKWIGLEVELCRAGRDRLPVKESLSGKEGRSSAFRSHYPVFRLSDDLLHQLEQNDLQTTSRGESK